MAAGAERADRAVVRGKDEETGKGAVLISRFGRGGRSSRIALSPSCKDMGRIGMVLSPTVPPAIASATRSAVSTFVPILR
jgi:hypothetical protein